MRVLLYRNAQQVLQLAGIEPAGVEAVGVPADQADALAAQRAGRTVPSGCRLRHGNGRPALARGERRETGGDRGILGHGIQIAAGDIAPPQCVRGKVDAAERVQPQPAAAARFGKGPQNDRGADGTGKPHGHLGIGEGQLQEQQQVEVGTRQGPRRPQGAGRVQHEPARAREQGAGTLQCFPGSAAHLFGQAQVEGRARQWDDADSRGTPVHAMPP